VAIVVRDIQDMRYLKWAHSRHSSGTAGSFLKAYEIVDGQKIYYKLSNYNSLDGIVGHECVNEIVVARLLEKLAIEHLDYDLIHALVSIEGKEYETYLCRSYDFKQAGEGKTAFDIFYEMKKEKGESMIGLMERYGWRSSLDNILMIDYVIQNRDRHGANIEVLKNRQQQTYRLAPLFDNGLSLIFNTKNDDEVSAFDVLEDKKVQCVFGGNSTRDNLALISDDFAPMSLCFDDDLKEYLFRDLDAVVSSAWIEKVYDMIKRRTEYYESICSKG